MKPAGGLEKNIQNFIKEIYWAVVTWKTELVMQQNHCDES
jgi:hypothetical protein